LLHWHWNIWLCCSTGPLCVCFSGGGQLKSNKTTDAIYFYIFLIADYKPAVVVTHGDQFSSIELPRVLNAIEYLLNIPPCHIFIMSGKYLCTFSIYISALLSMYISSSYLKYSCLMKYNRKK
jgi:hypothetical protein